MYAIIQTGSKQFKVKVGDIIEVEKFDAEVGASVKIDYVLAVGEEGGKLNVGTPRIENASVDAKILDQFRAKKVIAFKMKRRKGYRHTIGHRQNLSRIEITSINA